MSRFRLAIHPALRGMGIHDPSAAIFVDTELAFAAEEERYTRIKHAEGQFPERAIRACFDHVGIEMEDVDSIAIPWDVRLRRRKVDRHYLADALRRETPMHRRVTKIARYLYWNRAAESVHETVRERLAAIGDPVPEITPVPHHRSHAISAFHPSGFGAATVLTMDGEGEYDATVVWRAHGEDLTRLRTYKGYNSLGGFFGAITEFLGFRAYNGEGKVMGLAAYGERDPTIENRLREVIETGVDYDVSAIAAAGTEQGAHRLAAVLDREPKKSATEFSEWDRNLAHTAQALLEDIVTAIAAEYCGNAQTANLCVAGGVALNCKLNKQLMELDAVDDLFIQPVAHDAGTVIGAGLHDVDPADVPRMTEVYLGGTHDRTTTIDRLETNRIQYRESDDVVEETADALVDGEIVGWVQGRFEFGPRALGARSILADPRSAEARDRINERVKHRETWRPFAPSMLERAADAYLVNGTEAPFMIRTFDADPDRLEEIPAVLHSGDNTTRPQTVNAEQHPRYHALIEAFAERTGVPVLLNTSFNDKGEPIVNTPQEALKAFFGMGLDRLIIGEIVVEKSRQR